MSGKQKDPPIYDDVEQFIGMIVDQNKATWDELFTVAEQWCMQNYEHHHQYAKEKGILPITAILTALLYVSHPLICRPNGEMIGGFLRCAAEIIAAQVEERKVPIPVKPILSTVRTNSHVDSL